MSINDEWLISLCKNFVAIFSNRKDVIFVAVTYTIFNETNKVKRERNGGNDT